MAYDVSTKPGAWVRARTDHRENLIADGVLVGVFLLRSVCISAFLPLTVWERSQRSHLAGSSSSCVVPPSATSIGIIAWQTARLQRRPLE